MLGGRSERAGEGVLREARLLAGLLEMSRIEGSHRSFRPAECSGGREYNPES